MIFVRIVAGTLIGLAVLWLGLAWALRQPNSGREDYPGSARADAAKLEQHVRFLTAPGEWRSVHNAAGMGRAADYIARAFSATGATVVVQPFKAGPVETKNVIARFGLEARPRVVIGAHYDVFGDLPGADDNASGVAGLLELARLLDGLNLPTAVELVAYSSEEPPFFGGPEMGSAVHVTALKNAAVKVRAMISLEMIGFYAERQPNQGIVLSTVYPRHGRFIALVGRWADRDVVADAKKCFRGASPLEVVSYSGPTGLGADLSDQRNYWAAGIPAFMVTDTAFMRNPNYHAATDTADTLDYERMAQVVDGVFSTVVMLARH
ncbi:MAG TPA: M28 family peptidase [Candidatus Polarisedimenticolia bacterium]|nr:M28 family peptidase [Candidatus Polarisedimenticolia bacterium]